MSSGAQKRLRIPYMAIAASFLRYCLFGSQHIALHTFFGVLGVFGVWDIYHWKYPL